MEQYQDEIQGPPKVALPPAESYKAATGPGSSGDETSVPSEGDRTPPPEGQAAIDDARAFGDLALAIYWKRIRAESTPETHQQSQDLDDNRSHSISQAATSNIRDNPCSPAAKNQVVEAWPRAASPAPFRESSEETATAASPPNVGFRVFGAPCIVSSDMATMGAVAAAFPRDKSQE